VNKLYFKHIIIIAIILTAFSCRTVYRIQPDKVKHMSCKRLLNNTLSSYIDYNTLSIRFNAEFSDNSKSQSFSGLIRIQKDSLIWASISVALGVELARVLITPDSVKFMNRLKSEYFAESIDYIEQLFHADFTFDLIQNLLTNEIFLYADNDENLNNIDRAIEDEDTDIDAFKKTFHAKADSNMYVLKTHRKRKAKKYQKRNKPGVIIQNIYIAPEIFKISKVNVIDYSESRRMFVNYDKFSDVNGKIMPFQIITSIVDNNNTFSLKLDYTRYTVNSDISFSFNIPDKYKQINLLQDDE